MEKYYLESSSGTRRRNVEAKCEASSSKRDDRWSRNADHLKFAVTDLLADIVTLQTTEGPEQAPLQEENLRPATALAVSFTLVFAT